MGLAINCAQYYQLQAGTSFRPLKVSSPVAAPGAESAVYGCLVVNACLCRREISHVTNELANIYSTAVVTDDSGRENRLDPELTQIMATSRDYEQLKWAWQGWRNATGPRMKDLYAQLVDKMNEAAVDSGNRAKENTIK